MIHTHVKYPIFISKAKKNKQHKAMNDIADKHMDKVARSYRDGFDEVRDATKLKAIKEALDTDEVKNVVNTIKWEKFEADKADKLLAASLAQAGTASIAFVPTIAISDYTFDPRNPSSLKFLSETTANRITLVTETGKEATRIMAFEALDKGIPVPKASKMIRGAIGLNRPQAKALVNFRRKLVKEGLSEAKIEQRVAAWTKKAIRVRSQMIAQTELTDATSQGQLDMWDEAVKDKVIEDNEWEKVWIATIDSRTSRICADLNGQAVPLKKLFKDPKGLLGPFDRPSAHPRCRSSLIIRRRIKKK